MEQQFKQQGFKLIAGIDEAGRGPLAGPVVAAAVILPEKYSLEGVTDSKKLTPSKRETLYEKIITEALAWHIEAVDVDFINSTDIFKATLYAMQNCVARLSIKPDCVLIDGNQTIPGVLIPQFAIVKGDAKCKSISSASILAKVYRDKIMRELDKQYPQYCFAQNKGYGSKAHLEALKKFGPCPAHRKYYAPVALAARNKNEQQLELV